MDLNVDWARRLLRYEPQTGKLFWLDRPRELFSSDSHWKMWNTRFAGNEAFATDNGKGYLRGSIFGCMHRAHRVIWLLQTGEWPADDIDHINGCRTDNRWSNLRAATRTDNLRNRSRQINNSSGVNGVIWHKDRGRWQARIMVSGRYKSLGYFDDLESAAAARKAADTKYGFSERHGVAPSSLEGAGHE